MMFIVDLFYSGNQQHHVTRTSDFSINNFPVGGDSIFRFHFYFWLRYLWRMCLLTECCLVLFLKLARIQFYFSIQRVNMELSESDRFDKGLVKAVKEVKAFSDVGSSLSGESGLEFTYASVWHNNVTYSSNVKAVVPIIRTK